jgi:hypothetical protein
MKEITNSNKTSMLLFNYSSILQIKNSIKSMLDSWKLGLLIPRKEAVEDAITVPNRHTPITNIIMILLIASSMLVFSSCARKSTFLNSSVVPAAQGSVKVKTDNNKNYVIQIQIKDLADPGRLTPSKQSYVAWMETDQGRTENLGFLKTSKSFMSRQMTAKLETVSSYKPIKIFVTAENETNVQYPDRMVVLTTSSF